MPWVWIAMAIRSGSASAGRSPWRVRRVPAPRAGRRYTERRSLPRWGGTVSGALGGRLGMSPSLHQPPGAHRESPRRKCSMLSRPPSWPRARNRRPRIACVGALSGAIDSLGLESTTRRRRAARAPGACPRISHPEGVVRLRPRDGRAATRSPSTPAVDSGTGVPSVICVRAMPSLTPALAVHVRGGHLDRRTLRMTSPTFVLPLETCSSRWGT